MLVEVDLDPAGLSWVRHNLLKGRKLRQAILLVLVLFENLVVVVRSDLYRTEVVHNLLLVIDAVFTNWSFSAVS